MIITTEGLSTLGTQLDCLLSEDAALAVNRAQSSFDNLASNLGKSIVLFGAGGLGRKILDGLRSVGIEPLAFADNNPDLWNSSINGLSVLPPKEAAQRFGQSAIFAVTIWRAGGGHRFANTRKQLASLGCCNIISFGHLCWKYPDLFLPYYCLDLPQKVLQERQQIYQSLSLWNDEDSKREYYAQLKWRLWLDFDGLPSPVKHEQYFPQDLFLPSPDEMFVDCGAFDGDTLVNFLNLWGGNFSKYIGLEPDPANFQKLHNYVLTLSSKLGEKIETLSLAAAAKAGKISFEASGKASAASTEQGGIEVMCAPLDDILINYQPTFIKMDIEGAELKALQGASATIKRWSPILAISVYHCQNHLWRIPLFIRSISDSYSYFLRPHNEEGWDLVCYAVPKHRLISG